MQSGRGMRLIALGLLVLAGCASEGVEFEVVAPGLDPAEVIHVAGSWNGWQPDALPPRPFLDVGVRARLGWELWRHRAEA